MGRYLLEGPSAQGPSPRTRVSRPKPQRPLPATVVFRCREAAGSSGDGGPSSCLTEVGGPWLAGPQVPPTQSGAAWLGSALHVPVAQCGQGLLALQGDTAWVGR